jgi:O-succinylbenzoic acid--CoA ligase
LQNIVLNGKEFTTDFLRQYGESILNSGLTDYEIKTLQFCRQWLAGQETFQVETSGSTGKAKLIEIKREQMIASARLTGDALQLKKNDKVLLCLSAEHIAGMMMLVRSFVLEMHITIINPVSDPLAGFSAKEHFDFISLVPLQLYEIFKNSRKKLAILNKMKAILVGGAPVNPELEKKIQLIKAPVFSTYGMTETVSHIALKRLNGKEKSEYFKVLKGVEINTDNRNCLTIRSAVTNCEPLVTNDLVEIISNDTFKWLGRIDNVINSGGFKVQIEKVEQALEQVLAQMLKSESNSCFIGSVPDEKFGRRIIAVIEGPPFTQNKQKQMLVLLEQYLKKHEMPRQFHFTAKINRTKTGKIDRLATLKLISPSF